MCVPATLETVRDRIEREGPPRLSRRAAPGAAPPPSPPRYGVENLRNLKQLPPRGATIGLG